MTTIKAPFNFVPVSEKVFFPEWADQISHDIPFEDGESGIIELKITAESPIFVRNGHTKKQANNKDAEFKSFSMVDDRYFIPATTIKGAIRSVLEIMSFGKMRLDKNAMFAQREWNNPTLYSIKNPKEQQNLSCGYLKRRGNEYIVLNCGKPYRIGHDRIDEFIGQQILQSKFSQDCHFDLTKEVRENEKLFDPKTAIYKYHLLRDYLHIFNKCSFSEDTDRINAFQKRRIKFDNAGTITGRLVLTGSPDKWMYPRPTEKNPRAGKFYEFVFEDKINSDSIQFSELEFNHFKFIYSESPEWDRVRGLLEKDGVPVFFRMNADKTIKDIGLAFLYKLPYENSPFDTLKDDHKKDGNNGCKYEADMSDCLFGFTDGFNSLKGRVHISHAFSDTKFIPVCERIVTLGSPKASYYPLYIEQDTDKTGQVDQYATYNGQGQISGWKRYMIRNSIWGIKDEYNKNLDSILLPLDKNTEFRYKIRYHNLKTAELGALLSAITYHNTKDCRYQLGQGKPYGFGKVRMEITNIEINNLCGYLYEFEKVMEKHHQNWVNSRQIVELLTISGIPINESNHTQFEYLQMSNTPTQNEFMKVKGGQKGSGLKEGLMKYSAIIGQKIDVISIYSGRVKQEYEGFIASAQILKTQKKYDEAKCKLNEAAKLLPAELKHDELLNEINHILKLQEENAELLRLQEKRTAIIQAIIEGGLSFLEEKYPEKDEYKIKDFNTAKKRIDQWMKKAGVTDLPQEQWDYLKVTVKRLCQSAKSSKDIKEWSNPESYLWRAIQKYVGQDTANNWYSEFIKK
ncbi:hypothetical protein AGMMS49574_05390 [Bacteroidia bacterium]|nr:hypothetical protein AGMMS49574_05390 [Bacteroidia bacterium]